VLVSALHLLVLLWLLLAASMQGKPVSGLALLRAAIPGADPAAGGALSSSSCAGVCAATAGAEVSAAACALEWKPFRYYGEASQGWRCSQLLLLLLAAAFDMLALA
jgi:hypothetical protein